VTVPGGSGVSHLHFLTLTAKNAYLRLVNCHQQKPNFRFFGIFFVGFGFFPVFSIPTSVSVSVFLKYRDIGFGFRLPTISSMTDTNPVKELKKS